MCFTPIKHKGKKKGDLGQMAGRVGETASSKVQVVPISRAEKLGECSLNENVRAEVGRMQF